MSILINLLPDVRQAKLRDHQRRQMATGISVAIWVVCGAVVILMGIYAAGQKIVIAQRTQDINRKEDSLRQVPNLIDALTAQQHLASLPSLYKQRVYLTKFFNAYTQASPTTVTINAMNITVQNLMTVDGQASNYAAVSKLARALEDSNVLIGRDASASNTPYFSDVNITSVGTGSGGVNFTISATLASGVTNGNN